MTKPPLAVHVDPDGEPALALHDADEALVAPQSNSARVRVSRDDDLWAGYDPERVRASLHWFTGMLTPEGEWLKQLIYRARGRHPTARSTPRKDPQ